MYLLDTNVLSQLVRKHPPPDLIDRLGQHATDPLFTSCICVMELRQGALRRPDHGALWSRIEREILSRVEMLNGVLRKEWHVWQCDLIAALSVLRR